MPFDPVFPLAIFRDFAVSIVTCLEQSQLLHISPQSGKSFVTSCQSVVKGHFQQLLKSHFQKSLMSTSNLCVCRVKKKEAFTAENTEIEKMNGFLCTDKTKRSLEKPRERHSWLFVNKSGIHKTIVLLQMYNTGSLFFCLILFVYFAYSKLFERRRLQGDRQVHCDSLLMLHRCGISSAKFNCPNAWEIF